MLSACLSSTNRVAVDSEEPFSDTLTGSKELEDVAQKMTRSLVLLPQVASAAVPPKIAFLEVANNTNEILNKELFLRKMRTLLMQGASGKMVFIDRDKFEAIKREREAKRSGQFSGKANGTLSGADFFLTGTLDSIDKALGGKRSTYTRYSFRLTDAESGDIFWEDEYEVKKVGKAGLYDR
jgi:PBP1b-binding outer membrane lipoprotein LpoB